MTARSGRLSPAVGWTALGVAVVAAFVLIGVVLSAVVPAPSGPALSSYATTAPGLAAWAALLERDGHAVRQIREPLRSAALPSDATLVVLGNTSELTSADGRAVAAFVRRGGWVVFEGTVDTHNGGGSYGRVIGISDPRFLENDELARGTNAFRALALAGPSSRPVLFDEAIHGYGPATGLAALPERWWFAIALLALALGAFSLSRALRLGGSDPVEPAAASPRGAYVDALAESLVRTTGRDELVRRVEQAQAVEVRFRGSL